MSVETLRQIAWLSVLGLVVGAVLVFAGVRAIVRARRGHVLVREVEAELRLDADLTQIARDTDVWRDGGAA